MNVLYRVTRKMLIENKVRTAVTIVGIMLSAAMFMAVMTSVTSMQGYMLDIVKAQNGSWYANTVTETKEQSDAIVNDSRIAQSAVLQSQGYALISSTNKYKPYIYIAAFEENDGDMAAVVLTDGRMPEKKGEILMPKHLKSNGGVEFVIGDTVTLSVGRREWNGHSLTQQDAFYAEEDKGESEKLVDTAERTFTVVGFYSRPGWEPFSAPGYTALTVYDEECPDMGSHVFYRTKKIREIYNFVKEKDPEGLATVYNSEYLRFNGIGLTDGFNSMLYLMAAILSALIMFGSISLIYNAFSISVSERTVQFGILKSIGATKKQMRRSVMYEGVLLSLIGIPLGILAGILGMFITFKMIGGLFDLFIGNNITGVKFTIHLKWWAIAAASAVCLVTVFVSANIPAVRAARKPPIEAIRQSGEVRIKEKSVKTSRLTYFLFRFEGMLASKNFKRSRKRYRATVLSLSVSLVLFISASGFCGYLGNGVNVAAEEYNYDIYSGISASMMNKLSFEQIKNVYESAKDVTASTYMATFTGIMSLKKEAVPEDMWKVLAKSMELGEKEIVFLSAQHYFIKDSEYNEWIASLGLSPDDCQKEGEYLAVVYCDTSVYSGKYYHGSLLKESEKRINVVYSSSSDEENVYERGIAAYAHTVPIGVNKTNYEKSVKLIYPYSSVSSVMGKEFTDYMQNISFYLNSSNPSASCDFIKDTFEELGVNAICGNIAAEVATTRALVKVIKVFSYGFIVLISLISLANVFNTVSTNIGLRRKEFAMLKSVGMSKKGFNRMMNYECLLYGIKGTVYGLPAAILINFLMSRSMDYGVETKFVMPWGSIAIAVGSVFLVVFATMLYSMSKIRHDNTVETLRRDTA